MTKALEQHENFDTKTEVVEGDDYKRKIVVFDDMLVYKGKRKIHFSQYGDIKI